MGSEAMCPANGPPFDFYFSSHALNAVSCELCPLRTPNDSPTVCQAASPFWLAWAYLEFAEQFLNDGQAIQRIDSNARIPSSVTPISLRYQSEVGNAYLLKPTPKPSKRRTKAYMDQAFRRSANNIVVDLLARIDPHGHVFGQAQP
jgi:hypothetical protein